MSTIYLRRIPELLAALSGRWKVSIVRPDFKIASRCECDCIKWLNLCSNVVSVYDLVSKNLFIYSVCTEQCAYIVCIRICFCWIVSWSVIDTFKKTSVEEKAYLDRKPVHSRTVWEVYSRFFALCAADCVKLYTTTLWEFNLLHEVLILSKPVQKLEIIIYERTKSQKVLCYIYLKQNRNEN